MRGILLLPILLILLLASCTKSHSGSSGNQTPCFTVNGIADITFTNAATTIALPLTVQYNDSAQEMVTLSLSQLPAGITIDTTWLTSGYPTFSTTLTFYNLTPAGAAPGTYNIVLTATGKVTGSRAFPFTLSVKSPTACSASVAGTYVSCTSCTSGDYYTDSVYADSAVINKIWFSNFDDLGVAVYGTLNCGNDSVTIPAQTAGSYTFSGKGSFADRLININSLLINTDSCFVVDENARLHPVCLAKKR